jgi:RNA polymerase sigma factor (sigma-70 family)
MTSTFLDSVLRGAEALAARDAVGTLADLDLVRRFAAERDPAAFAVLVRRHGPLVWGVCRNLLASDADAEDAFQATFLALIRSAGSVRRAEALGGWLHGVAYRIALKARRSAARRRQREAAVAVPEPDRPVPDAAWDELQAAVHQEVCRLPEKLRLPFILCGLQGRPQKDAAKQLGWKVGTLSARLTQARQRLLDRLARRGVPVGVAAGAAVLGMVSGSAAVPASVCLKALSAARDPAAASPGVLSLAHGATLMSLNRTKLLAVAVLAAGVLTTGIGARLLSTADAQAPSNHEPDLEQVQKAINFLRATHAKGRWEYKFVEIKKPLRIGDLQKVLAAAELEDWEYCGSQDLASADEMPRAIPHLVFKRPFKVAAVNENVTARALAALAAAQADAQDKRKAEDIARRAAHEARMAQEQYASQLQAAQAALAQERDRAAALEKQVRQAHEEHEAIRRKIDELRSQKATETMTLPLRHMTARAAAEAIVKMIPDKSVRLTYDDRTNSLVVQGSPEALAAVRELITRRLDVAATGDAARSVTVRVRLANVDGKTAAKSLAGVEGIKISEIHPDAIILNGPAKLVEEVTTRIQKSIDVKPDAAKEPEGVTVIRLKYSVATEVHTILEQVFGKRGTFAAEPVTNAVLVRAPANILAEVKDLVKALDIPREPRK